MKVRLKKDGRLVPGGSHPYWREHIKDWKELRKKEVVDVNVVEFAKKSHKSEKELYESGVRGLLANKYLHKEIKVEDGNIHKAIEKEMEEWEFKDFEFFFHKNLGLEEVKGSKLKDKIQTGGEN